MGGGEAGLLLYLNRKRVLSYPGRVGSGRVGPSSEELVAYEWESDGGFPLPFYSQNVQPVMRGAQALKLSFSEAASFFPFKKWGV